MNEPLYVGGIKAQNKAHKEKRPIAASELRNVPGFYSVPPSYVSSPPLPGHGYCTLMDIVELSGLSASEMNALPPTCRQIAVMLCPGELDLQSQLEVYDYILDVKEPPPGNGLRLATYDLVSSILKKANEDGREFGVVYGSAPASRHAWAMEQNFQHGEINWANVAKSAMANASEGAMHKIFTVNGLNNLVLAADLHISASPNDRIAAAFAAHLMDWVRTPPGLMPPPQSCGVPARAMPVWAQPASPGDAPPDGGDEMSGGADVGSGGGGSGGGGGGGGGGSSSGIDPLWEDDEHMLSAAPSEAGEEAGEEAPDWYGKSLDDIYDENFQFDSEEQQSEEQQ
jgi:hypothetical protein